MRVRFELKISLTVFQLSTLTAQNTMLQPPSGPSLMQQASGLVVPPLAPMPPTTTAAAHNLLMNGGVGAAGGGNNVGLPSLQMALAAATAQAAQPPPTPVSLCGQSSPTELHALQVRSLNS